MLKPLPYTKVRITDPDWVRRIDLVRTVVLPYQWEILNDRVEGAEKSYCVRNFRAAAGDIKAEHGGMVFQDSDIYKWLEAVAYALSVSRDAGLEALADEAVELIVRASASRLRGSSSTMRIVGKLMRSSSDNFLQQIRGNCSPLIQSTTRRPPRMVVISTGVGA